MNICVESPEDRRQLIPSSMDARVSSQMSSSTRPASLTRSDCFCKLGCWQTWRGTSLLRVSCDEDPWHKKKTEMSVSIISVSQHFSSEWSYRDDRNLRLWEVHWRVKHRFGQHGIMPLSKARGHLCGFCSLFHFFFPASVMCSDREKHSGTEPRQTLLPERRWYMGAAGPSPNPLCFANFCFILSHPSDIREWCWT